jgi:hypothetical protein
MRVRQLNSAHRYWLKTVETINTLEKKIEHLAKH